jgi:hypothetical protein
LYSFSIVALACAWLILILCINQRLKYAHNKEEDKEISIIEKFQNMGDTQITDNKEKVSSLVSQSGEFAFIIDPPKPPVPPEEKKVESPKIVLPVVSAPRPLSARFKVLSTSCNRDNRFHIKIKSLIFFCKKLNCVL